MKNRINIIFIALMIISGCRTISVDQNIYTVTANSVTQKPYTAVSDSPVSIYSDYKDGFSKSTKAVVQFKFSINGFDNENKPGDDHFVLIKPENKNYVTPVLKFGEELKGEKELSKIEDQFLPVNSETIVTFRVDCSNVLKSLKEHGYYQTYTGSRITRESFEGIFIAGAVEPLSWNFGEIQKNPDYKMEDPDSNGIYECKITFRTNDYRSIDEKGSAVWNLKKDISEFPKYDTRDVLRNALYNMSLEELLFDIRHDSTFMAGAKWNGVWTRDISYSIYLSLALIRPDIARLSLMKKVKNRRIIQDTGTGGSWPVSTDRIVWAVAAWEIYLVTGDNEWLKYAYDVIKNSANADLLNAFNKEMGLLYGESSFLDWREQTYPLWMNPVDIYKSLCLGTNALHFRTFEILNLMENELDISDNKLAAMPGQIKAAINKHFWMEEKGYFGQYLYGRNSYSLSPGSESLGEALCVLFNIADESRSKTLIENTPVTEYGVPCIFPQIKNIPPYHNNAVWPFVMSYWTWAASRTGNEKVVEFGIDAVTRAAALFLTNKENMVADNGHFEGTEINSDRMLWSIAGNLAAVYRIIFGINLTPEGLLLSPFVPRKYSETNILTNFKYRNSVLDLKIHGHGSKISRCLINNMEVEKPLITPDLTGHHTIEIFLDDKFDEAGKINIVKNHFAPSAPVVSINKDKLTWQHDPEAVSYKVLKNGKSVTGTKELSYTIEPSSVADEYSVIAVDDKGYESFMSEPILIYHAAVTEIEINTHEFEHKVSGFTGTGYIRTNMQNKSDITVEADINETGFYLIDFRYANGNGPLNTFNACGIRSLFIDDNFIAAVTFPQRGDNVWENWGYSNSVRCYLKKGKNKITLKYLQDNNNMNGEINEALIDNVRVVPVS